MTSITGQPETPPGTTHQEAERAEAAGRGIDEGADESDRLGPRVIVRHGRQENGAGRHI